MLFLMKLAFFGLIQERKGDWGSISTNKNATSKSLYWVINTVFESLEICLALWVLKYKFYSPHSDVTISTFYLRKIPK